MNIVASILSFSILVIFLVLLLIRKTSLIWVSLITLLFAIVIGAFYWQMQPSYIFGSVVKGFLVSIDIVIIVFGAVLFLEITKKAGVVKDTVIYLENISKDIRIQVILLAWFFENFLEGTAGFGTPSAVVAPLLISLGLSPINAVVIALLGNSASVAFGAVGTPIKVGFGSLAKPPVADYAVWINLAGILVPIFMLWFLTKDKSNAKKLFWEALPFTLWAGFAFSASSILGLLFGQEFPSVIGSVIGLILVLITTKLNIFVPKNTLDHSPKDGSGPAMSLKKVIMPYVVLLSLLIFGKMALGDSTINIPNQIRHGFAFFNPGFAMIVSGIITAVYFRIKRLDIRKIVLTSLRRSLEPFLVIVFMATLAQVLVNSGMNSSGLPSIIHFFASGLKSNLLPLLAPVAGAFGSFLTGSATVSNLMFGNFLVESANDLRMNSDKILALALVGGAAGNMIALADIIAAETVTGLKNQERQVLKGVIIPCLIYVSLVGLIGLFFM